MANVISLNKARAAQNKGKNKGKTLCKNGHHKWQIVQGKPFDSKQGKLVTECRCQRCGQRKVKAL